MVFLSRTSLNPLRSDTQALVSDPQKLHSLVRRVVSPSCPGRILWRLEEDKFKYDLYVLSPDAPTLEPIVEKYGWRDHSGQPTVAELDSLLGQIAVGREFAFRVTLNPVTSTRQPIIKPTESQARALEAGQRSIRVAHRTAYHQLEWFIGRATGESLSWGFEVTAGANGSEARISSRRRLRFRKPAGGHVVTLETVTYDGKLRITDAEKMRNSLVNGIGKGKAYGCGLLTLAPVR